MKRKINSGTRDRELWQNIDPQPGRAGGGRRWDLRMTRRSFLKLMGAQVAMYSLAGCMKPVEKIVPYARTPEEIVPGKPLFYASAVSLWGSARGILVRSDTGRPTKIEGNPGHPDSLGATDAVTQALIYQLYDPERSRSVVNGGNPSSWQDFLKALGARLQKLRAARGEGLRFLSQPVISPTLGFLSRQILAGFPRARWHQYSALNRDLTRQALMTLYGRDLQPVYRLPRADVILSIESDFLVQGPGALAYARAFADRRETQPDSLNLNRMYAVESTPTLTGAAADHRIICHPSEMAAFAAVLLEIVQNGRTGAGGALPPEKQEYLDLIARELMAHRGRSLIVAGQEQPVDIQIAAFRLNDILGNTGSTVEYVPSTDDFPESGIASISGLAEDLRNGSATDLIILDANPAYAAPRDLDLPGACRKAGFVAHLGLYFDETAQLSHWHIPMADELESWGDARAFDGTVTVRQPLIRPLYNGITAYEFCMACLGGAFPPYGDVIRGYWQKQLNRPDFDLFWRQSLHDGVIKGSGFRPVAVRPLRAAMPAGIAAVERRWTLLIRPDPYILDGRFANNSWLQELPKPLTKLTWGNVALIAPASADQFRLKSGDVLEISAKNITVDAPVYVLPGQAPEVLTVHLGYGRTAAGANGTLVGFDAYGLQNSASPWQTADFTFRKKKKNAVLATTQHYGMLSGERHLLLIADLAQYVSDPGFVKRLIRVPERRETLYRPDEHLKGEYQWAMSIDLNRCTGCGACTMACQVENNIAVVGKKEVKRNREMHWIRVDRYYRGTTEAPDILFQPVPCMHCEDAPCELVCPVEATSHSSEGLNEMTYNRCVGTRYCSNNCPYKVRRFNFFDYNHLTASELLSKNPDVTVRSRGVMEKCTYCLQRITRARIAAKEENRKIRDGEIVPACAQACPTRAIVFGDIRDPASAVSRKKRNPLNYGILEETGARPRTTYLARIRNTNRDKA